MFSEHTDSGYHEVAPGISIKAIAYGERTLMAEFRLARGAKLPEHSHPHEQTGYLVSGSMVLRIDGIARTLAPGDAWTVPPDAAHGADISEDSVAVEVFSPVREDYLKYR